MKNSLLDNRSVTEQSLKQKYNNARNNLLLVIIFSVINIVLLVANINSYFLFSASVPYMLTDIGMFLCGRYPAEYYTGELEGFQALPSAVFYVLLAIAVITLLLYFLAFLLSKNGKVGWLIFSLVLFSLDMGVMFMYFGIALDMILDMVFHIWVIVILAIGIRAHYKLKDLPTKPQAEVIEGLEQSDDSNETVADIADSPILRNADFEIKSRKLLEFEALGHQIVYRRVKKVNELVIDGNVYAEYEALMEKAHSLTAVIDGHEISVGFDGVGSSYGMVDGHISSRKVRFF